MFICVFSHEAVMDGLIVMQPQANTFQLCEFNLFGRFHDMDKALLPNFITLITC